MRIITNRGGRRGGTGERFVKKDARVLISHDQKEGARKDDTQEIGEGISDNPIGSSNQLGLFTENGILSQKDIQRYKDVIWERESNQVKQDSQGEGKHEGTIKLPDKEGVE